MAGGQVDIAGLTSFEVEALEEELLARTLELLGFRGRAEFRPLLGRPAEGEPGPVDLAMAQSAGVASARVVNCPVTPPAERESNDVRKAP
jgi:hypothetical protein